MKPRGTSGAVSAPELLEKLDTGDIAPPCDIADPRATLEVNQFVRHLFSLGGVISQVRAISTKRAFFCILAVFGGDADKDS